MGQVGELTPTELLLLQDLIELFLLFLQFGEASLEFYVVCDVPRPEESFGVIRLC